MTKVKKQIKIKLKKQKIKLRHFIIMSVEKTMKTQTLIMEKEEIKNEKKELKDEQKFNYPRSTVEMLEQTLQIA